MHGGAGRDILHGGAGRDVLDGGAGDDDYYFRYEADASEADVIDKVRDSGSIDANGSIDARGSIDVNDLASASDNRLYFYSAADYILAAFTEDSFRRGAGDSINDLFVKAFVADSDLSFEVQIVDYYASASASFTIYQDGVELDSILLPATAATT